jgi:hypothetical protein
MEKPKDIILPFFAYGIFRPGQLGFFQLKELVKEIKPSIEIRGCLLLRDGLPIIDPEGRGEVKGVLLEFHSDKTAEAYDRIAAMEPDKHYTWGVADAHGVKANVLFGRNSKKGSVSCEEMEWSGWDDPLFNDALKVIEETINSNESFEFDFKRLFRLQMAYLLLWSAIERYVSLRYHLGEKVFDKVKRLANEESFCNSLKENVKEQREVCRADRPSDKIILDGDYPKKALEYYYQIRSNITHRGKAASQDFKRVRESLKELLAIFKSVLEDAKKNSKQA